MGTYLVVVYETVLTCSYGVATDCHSKTSSGAPMVALSARRTKSIVWTFLVVIQASLITCKCGSATLMMGNGGNTTNNLWPYTQLKQVKRCAWIRTMVLHSPAQGSTYTHARLAQARRGQLNLFITP